MDFDAMMGDDSWLQDSPPRLSEPLSKPSNKRAKAMNIDDLLKDHYKDKNRKLDREAERIRTFVSDSEDSSDEEFGQKTHKEVQFEELVECCEKQVHAGGATLDILKWGEILFCGQSHQEPSVCLSLESPLVRALLAAKKYFTYDSVESEKDEQTAEAFVAELLASGWFISFNFKLDHEIMYWILDTMLFTIDKDLEKAACEFLCHTLESDCDCSWIPSYSSILKTFEAYGYVGPEVPNNQTSKDLSNSNAHPSHNLGSFLRFLSTCLRKRHLHQSYPREDVEKLAVLIASLPLDRSLLCLGFVIQKCLIAVLNSFTEDEWHISCERIAISIAKVNRQVVNNLKLTRTLHNREARMKSLQSVVALHLFAKIANEKAVSGVWDMLSVFRKTDVKKTVMDFASLYYQMSMADIWLWSNPVLKSEKGALEAWLHFLKSCSFQISSTDWRPYATKVRNHASYLLQVYQCYYQGDDYEET